MSSQQIRTGYVPDGLSSDTFSLEYVPSTILDLVEKVHAVFLDLRRREVAQGARRANRAKWKIAMSYDLFVTVSTAWATAYWAYIGSRNPLVGGTTIDSNSELLDFLAGLRRRMQGDLEARTGQFLMVDGLEIPVILTDHIPVLTSQDGTYTTDMILFLDNE